MPLKIFYFFKILFTSNYFPKARFSGFLSSFDLHFMISGLEGEAKYYLRLTIDEILWVDQNPRPAQVSGRHTTTVFKIN